MVRIGHTGEIRRLMSRHPGFSIAGVVALLLLLATAAVAAATSLEVPRCDGLKLRTGPSTSETVRAVVGTRTTLTVDTQVSGSPWQTLCAGQLLSGSRWARISVVGGKTVQSQYGVPYVYAAAGLLQPIPSASPTAPRASPKPQPTAAPPTAPAATEAPSASPTVSGAPPTVAAATPTASARPSLAAAGPVTTQTGSPADPLISPAATIVLVLAVLSTMLSWFAVADRRRRRARRVPVPESVPASRLEDALH